MAQYVNNGQRSIKKHLNFFTVSIYLEFRNDFQKRLKINFLKYAHLMGK